MWKTRQTEILLLGPEETPDPSPGSPEVCGVMNTIQTTREVIFTRNQQKEKSKLVESPWVADVVNTT